MQRCSALLVLCAAANVWAVQGLAAAAGPPYAAHRPSFMVFGDSLTEFGYGWHWKYTSSEKGWVALLAEAYSRKADILNRGMSGYNSRWGLQVLPQALADAGCSQRRQRSSWRQRLQQLQQQAAAGQCNTQLLTIWFGANDAVDAVSDDGRLHVPVEEYRKNLAAMVAAARQAGVQQVVLITPPPVDEAAWAKEKGKAASDRTNAQVDLYAAAAREVAKQAAVPLLDVHAIFKGAGNTAALLNDGVHLSPEGNRLVAASLAQLIGGSPELTGLRAGDLPNHYPLFNQVDEAHSERTFKELWEQGLVAGGGKRATKAQ